MFPLSLLFHKCLLSIDFVTCSELSKLDKIPLLLEVSVHKDNFLLTIKSSGTQQLELVDIDYLCNGLCAPRQCV